MVAVIVAAPSATPVTRPEASTVATDWSLDDQENCAPATARPFTSNAWADRPSVAPTATEPDDGDTVTETGTTGTNTETSDEPVTPPAVAVIVTEPSAMPVTKPDASTVATDSSLDDQEKSSPAKVRPSASYASAERRSVSPTVRESDDGVTVTDATGTSTPVVRAASSGASSISASSGGVASLPVPVTRTRSCRAVDPAGPSVASHSPVTSETISPNATPSKLVVAKSNRNNSSPPPPPAYATKSPPSCPNSMSVNSPDSSAINSELPDKLVSSSHSPDSRSNTANS